MNNWDTIHERLQTISRPVRIVLTTNDPSQPSTRSALEILSTLAEDTPNLQLLVKDGKEPLAITLETAVQRSPIRFFGVPSGFELLALVDAILVMGSGQTKFSSLPNEVRALLQSIAKSVDSAIYVAPT